MLNAYYYNVIMLFLANHRIESETPPLPRACHVFHYVTMNTTCTPTVIAGTIIIIVIHTVNHHFGVWQSVMHAFFRKPVFSRRCGY